MSSVTVNDTLSDVVLPGGPNSSGWWLLDLNWDDSPEPKHQVEQRPAGFDGGFEPLDLNVASRVLELVGAHESVDSVAAERAVRERLAAWVKRRLTVTMTDDDGSVRVVSGVMQGRLKATRLDEYATRFSVVIECADPLKYGPLVVQSGSSTPPGGGGLLFPIFDETGFAEFTELAGNNRVFVANEGSEASFPEFTVPGPFTGFSFVSKGRAIEFSRVVPAGQSVRVDSAQESVWIGQSDVSAFLVRDEFFAIPPGGEWVQFFASGAVPFTIRSRSAWL
jgi:hypothetical protein